MKNNNTLREEWNKLDLPVMSDRVKESVANWWLSRTTDKNTLIEKVEGMKKGVYKDEKGLHLPRPSDHSYNQALDDVLSLINNQ